MAADLAAGVGAELVGTAVEVVRIDGGESAPRFAAKPCVGVVQEPDDASGVLAGTHVGQARQRTENRVGGGGAVGEGSPVQVGCVGVAECAHADAGEVANSGV